jgi:hypothetical protein
MFAVNYKTGGEDDPILTFCDQNINGLLAKGLFKRFFAQRFAILRHGKKYIASFNLNNSDVMNWLHREFKIIGKSKYQLNKINNYMPLLEQTTECELWRWYPVSEADNDSTYPSFDSVINATPLINSLDFRYIKLVALPSDILK